MKKTIIAVLLTVAFAVPSNAGVTRFTAKHVVKPAVKLGFKAAVATAKLGWKIAF